MLLWYASSISAYAAIFGKGLKADNGLIYLYDNPCAAALLAPDKSERKVYVYGIDIPDDEVKEVHPTARVSDTQYWYYRMYKCKCYTCDHDIDWGRFNEFEHYMYNLE